jgi:hypothetical protein
MGEVVARLEDAAPRQHMPMREMNSIHQREVYEAAGRLLDPYVERGTLGIIRSARFLVRLTDGRLVDLPFIVREVDEVTYEDEQPVFRLSDTDRS